MVSNSQRQVLSLLFGDIVGFSKIKDDQILKSIKDIAEAFRRNFLNDENHVHFNTWGDAFFIASSDPVDLLELGLDLRDWYRNRNWQKLNLDSGLPIRIGIHTETCTIYRTGDGIADIVGQHVSAAARIEPIVPPNEIYCTSTFRNLVVDRTRGFASFQDVGQKELSKMFGRMQLFSVTRTHESTTATVAAPTSEQRSQARSFSMTVPKIRKDFTDKEKREMEKGAFPEIAGYFEKALGHLQSQDPDLVCEFETVDQSKFICRVFVKGEQKASCQIWHVSDGMNRGIHYSETISDRNNSMNESLHAETDGYTLFLRPMGMFMIATSGDKQLSVEQASHYLWSGLMRQLAN